MRRLLSSMLVLSLFALAACGGDDDVDPGGASDSSVGGTTATTVAPDTPVSGDEPVDPVEPGAAERVEPQPDAVNVHPVSFTPADAQAVDENGPGVLVRFYGGIAPCFVLQRYEVEETSETVTVRLYGGAAPGAGDVACIEIAILYEVLVPLEAPLGDRSLIDGSQA